MNLRNLTRFLTVLLAINFGGQLVCTTSSPEVVMEIDFDQDSEKEESKKEKASDKLDHRQKTAELESYLASSLQLLHGKDHWTSPCLEINSPPPELV